ncbi:MAG: hypothetical protein EVJ46_03645 [Candidatus Acididesulfobacter guangdongensis]|uniref:DUF86 domain-containing protein n=1 Tax=Acididesulfobacter guangdongensis TaxID=2597225 RepID=A0A519BJ90_ACIG2|nr:MAG: hypothetical protein EVJ46_03645 [Candidatus Acididesulfobacter guangdongensis]
MNDELDVDRLRLLNYVYECDRHIIKIKHALSKMKNFMPLTLSDFGSLSEDDKEHIDQLIFRYSKLQDSMGEKLFPSILKNLKEDYEHKPLRDIIDRLEKLEIIERADDWEELRKSRNFLSHEYSTEENELVININNVYGKLVPKIFLIYERIILYIENNIVK